MKAPDSILVVFGCGGDFENRHTIVMSWDAALECDSVLCPECRKRIAVRSMPYLGEFVGE